MATKTVSMELQDIQGLLIRSHKEMSYAKYLMAHIREPEKAKSWLSDIFPEITNGISKPTDFRLQIAFTHSGIRKLCNAKMYGFVVEFEQGMATDFRSRVLGDLEESAPRNWEWGGPNNKALDFVLMVFAPSEQSLSQKHEEILSLWTQNEIEHIISLDAPPNPHGKEHFGFADGITQPVMPGLSKTDLPENTVAQGEFILGYPNGYDQLPATPLLKEINDPDQQLPASKEAGFRDFGKNGSYMVFRQLEQDVEGFWKQVKEGTKQIGKEESACVYTASKMVGRWPNGKPMTQDSENESQFDPKEKYFLYLENEDKFGHKCPLGSHVRRTNPRDVLPDNKSESSIEISNLHRILRRGRIYGPPLHKSFSVEKIKDIPNDNQKRGLHFICFNANIARQFEFIQHMWCNNTKFDGLYNDPDPVLGIKDYRDRSKKHDFTIQSDPVRQKIYGLTRHVEIKGGAYFFMPGLRALKFLSQQNDTI